jgi:hypothetical protein
MLPVLKIKSVYSRKCWNWRDSEDINHHVGQFGKPYDEDAGIPYP